MKKILVSLVIIVLSLTNMHAQYKKSEQKKLKSIRTAVDDKNLKAFKSAFDKMYGKKKNYMYNKDYDDKTILAYVIQKGLPYFTEYVIDNGYDIRKDRWRERQMAVNKAWDIKKENEKRVTYLQTLKEDFKRTNPQVDIAQILLSKRSSMVYPYDKGSERVKKIDSVWLHTFFDYCETLPPFQSLSEMERLLRWSRVYKHRVVSDNMELSLSLFEKRGIPLYQKYLEEVMQKLEKHFSAGIGGYAELLKYSSFIKENNRWWIVEDIPKDKSKPDLRAFFNLMNTVRLQFLEDLDAKICAMASNDSFEENLKQKTTTSNAFNSVKEFYELTSQLNNLYASLKESNQDGCLKNKDELLTNIYNLIKNSDEIAYDINKRAQLKANGMFLETVDFSKGDKKTYGSELFSLIYEGRFEDNKIYRTNGFSSIEMDNLEKLATIYHMMNRTSQSCTSGQLHRKEAQIMKDVCIEERVVSKQISGREVSRTCSKTREAPTGKYTSTRMYLAYQKQKSKTNSLSGVWDGLKSVANRRIHSKKELIEAVNSDFDRILKLNGCESKALERLEENFIRFLLKEPAIILKK